MCDYNDNYIETEACINLMPSMRLVSCLKKVNELELEMLSILEDSLTEIDEIACPLNPSDFYESGCECNCDCEPDSDSNYETDDDTAETTDNNDNADWDDGCLAIGIGIWPNLEAAYDKFFACVDDTDTNTDTDDGVDAVADEPLETECGKLYEIYKHDPESIPELDDADDDDVLADYTPEEIEEFIDSRDAIMRG